ncbi:phosphatase PAP2 family protein [Streptomyces sp. NPDC046275]|uniref:phosphatase PAP2 family protein n=1 Tax=Streptomyces sp. NPDC046275 TaxID=3157201 RepID=UPI0033CBBABE
MGETTVKSLESRTNPSAPIVSGGRARLRPRTPRRPRIWFEVLLIAVSYWLYSLIRNAVPEQKAQALKNADWIWQAEHSLGLAFEHTVNHAVNSVTWLIVSMNYYYATLHFVVTIGVLVWLYRWHPGRYAAFRTVLFATTGVALVGYYLYPLAPPRLMNGQNFVDTVLVHHTWGSMASGNLKHMSNQYAAMPSMHIGWSLWCGLTIFLLAKAPWARILGLLYPVATLVVIVATANHFWMDAVGGILCLAFGFGASYVWYGSRPHKLPKLVEPAASRPQGIPAGERAGSEETGTGETGTSKAETSKAGPEKASAASDDQEKVASGS